MNRLILVGNGFDLAHGLKTSYRDFIDDFWSAQIELIKQRNYSNVENDFFSFSQNKTIYDVESQFTNFEELNNLINYTVIFKNKFLKLISEKCYENWVDIEEEYYNQLKDAKAPDLFSPPNKINKIVKLNHDFEAVKSLLINYLKKIDKTSKINGKICDKIYSYFTLRDFSLDGINAKVKIELEKRKISIEAIESENIDLSEATNDSDEASILSRLIGGNKETGMRDLLENGNRKILDRLEMLPEEILVLNFNYTDTPFNYLTNNRCNRQNIITNINCIHGNLNDIEVDQNPVIFGFGDDVDEKYKEFENLNDNRYLTYFKSIAYSQTDHYKRLLEFVESNSYQVYIFGHSCGISDRTMLNTIFEHDNCKSIKPFYHKKQDRTDNYTDLIQNISRNFNNKKKFRDRVVNKTYCEPLT